MNSCVLLCGEGWSCGIVHQILFGNKIMCFLAWRVWWSGCRVTNCPTEVPRQLPMTSHYARTNVPLLIAFPQLQHLNGLTFFISKFSIYSVPCVATFVWYLLKINDAYWNIPKCFSLVVNCAVWLLNVTLIKVCYKQLNCTGMYSAGIWIVEMNFVWLWC